VGAQFEERGWCLAAVLVWECVISASEVGLR